MNITLLEDQSHSPAKGLKEEKVFRRGTTELTTQIAQAGDERHDQTDVW